MGKESMCPVVVLKQVCDWDNLQSRPHRKVLDLTQSRHQALTQLANLRGYHVAATWRYRGYHVENVTSKRRDFVESRLRRRHVFYHVYTTL